MKSTLEHKAADCHDPTHGGTFVISRDATTVAKFQYDLQKLF